jgi:hypothetical protein
MFTIENTEGYTAAELAALNAEIARLNAEIARRLAGVDRDSDEYQEIVKAFYDEVAQS